MTLVPFGARLAAALAERGPLCVGIDPHPYLLRAWGLADDARGLEELGRRVVAACAGVAAAVKPQVAFFERHGSAGYAALEAVLADARAAGLLVLADAKRGDVGSTVAAYGEAWLTPGSPLESDAVTLSPYLGVGALAEPVRLALAHGKGAFVLAATSNPEASLVQRARPARGDASVAAAVLADLRRLEPAPLSGHGATLGSLGVVVGATVTLADYGIEPEDLVGIPVLAPGFGHQGAEVADLPRLFGPAASGVLVAASRSILEAGPGELAAAVRRHAQEAAACLA